MPILMQNRRCGLSPACAGAGFLPSLCVVLRRKRRPFVLRRRFFGIIFLTGADAYAGIVPYHFAAAVLAQDGLVVEAMTAQKRFVQAFWRKRQKVLRAAPRACKRIFGCAHAIAFRPIFAEQAFCALTAQYLTVCFWHKRQRIGIAAAIAPHIYAHFRPVNDIGMVFGIIRPRLRLLFALGIMALPAQHAAARIGLKRYFVFFPAHCADNGVQYLAANALDIGVFHAFMTQNRAAFERAKRHGIVFSAVAANDFVRPRLALRAHLAIFPRLPAARMQTRLAQKRPIGRRLKRNLYLCPASAACPVI